MKLESMSCIFPSNDIVKTANYYESKIGFRQVQYLGVKEPHICLYRDATEIILTQSISKEVRPNHKLYGYGYDAYFYTKNQKDLMEEFERKGVKIIRRLEITDYKNNEFVIEDIDGRWIAFGIKE
ncbi:glyoxalase [Clostridium sartagoforme]|uniref:Glyoxalase n=1 Tax=Clostridium sartagoforme TaxID=84031 RepID=A0A4V3RLH1_9CLOT|nr:VOC family protein [Clostridium sartagoforme]TGY43710.1 glyoxalase [Clostridium sartagoforme]